MRTLHASTWLLAFTLAACNGEETDDTAPVVIDADKDGSPEDEDCDDDDADVYPGADEVCDGKDNDCDVGVDEDAVDAATWFGDFDGDGYGVSGASDRQACTQPENYAAEAGDCTDTDPLIYPGAPERCNLRDDDCDDEIDEGAPAKTWYADADGDGFGDLDTTMEVCAQPDGYVANSEDCDDTLDIVHPDATEVCNTVDDDCDDLVDAADDSMSGDGTFYADTDGDGFGDATSSVVTCTPGDGYVLNDDDCNDDASSAYPGADEVCDDAIDNDCDTDVDEGCDTGGDDTGSGGDDTGTSSDDTGTGGGDSGGK